MSLVHPLWPVSAEAVAVWPDQSTADWQDNSQRIAVEVGDSERWNSLDTRSAPVL